MPGLEPPPRIELGSPLYESGALPLSYGGEGSVWLWVAEGAGVEPAHARMGRDPSSGRAAVA